MHPPPPAPNNAEIRAWARAQGMDVADRGRLPARLVEAYAAAHGGHRQLAVAPVPTAVEPEPVAPEPAPTFDGLTLTPTPTPTPDPSPSRSTRRRPRWVPAALGALAGLVLATAVLFLVLRDDEEGTSTASGAVTFDDVELGDCTAEIPEGVTLTVTLLPCDEPHEGEVYATFELSGDDYPGADEVERFALGGRQREAVAALPPDDETLYDLVYLAPSQQTWDKGDRTVSCVLSDPTGKPLVGAVLEGTAGS